MTDSTLPSQLGNGFQPGAPVLARPTAADVRPLVRPVAPAEARRLLLASVGAGLLFQLLFAAQAPGINVLCWTAAVLCLAALAGPRPARLARSDVWLPVMALTFAAFIALRTSWALVTFDSLAVLVLTAASVAAFSGIAVTRRSLDGLIRLAVQGGLVTISGALRLAPGLRGRPQGMDTAAMTNGRRVLLGLGLAALPVLVFVLLFAAADAVFGSLLGRLLDWRLDSLDLAWRLALGTMAGWLVAGWLVLVVAATRRMRRDRAASLSRLGGIEAATVLWAVDLVFAAFVVVQAGYLFGGLDTAGVSGLGYAEYARRGFLELVVAAILAGGLLFALETLVSGRSRAYVAAALGLVGLTGLVLASSAYRMALYQAAFGWTELRFHVAAAIVWLVSCLLAAAVAIVRDRLGWLPHAAVVLGLLVAVGVDIADPQAFVAGQNVQRALTPGQVPAGGSSGLDAEYLAHLGPDAVPVLVDALWLLPEGDRGRVGRALRRQGVHLSRLTAATGWPSWNLAREQAREALRGASLSPQELGREAPQVAPTP